MKRRSSTRKCLLCLGRCVSSSTEEENQEEYFGIIAEKPGRLTMAGAGKSNQLRLQLEKIFILRKILDIPESWCEETLQSYDGGGENSKINSDSGGVDGNPANWFAVCSQCMDTSVKEIWTIYQQVMTLEVKMKEIKEQIKGRMLKKITRPRIRNWGRNVDGGVEEKIVHCLFPGLVTPKAEKNDGDYHFDDNENEDRDFDFGIEMDYISTYGADHSEDNEIDIKPKVGSSKRRKRGKYAKRKSSGKPRKPAKDHNRGWHRCLEAECKATYRNRNDLEAHTQLHAERKLNGEAKTELDCPHCSFPARNDTELKMHIKKRHRLQNRPYYFPCPKCDFKVRDDFQSLKSHFDREHPSNDQSQRPASDEPIQCEHCPKRCETLRSFLNHQKSYHPEQMGMQVEALECAQCGMKFSTRLQLQIHVNSKHSNRKWKSKFVCEECGEGFKFQAALNYHKIKHQKQKNFLCGICGLDYSYKWLLDVHCRKFHPSPAEDGQGETASTGKLAETDRLKNNFNCKYCDFTCNIKGIMIRHLQRHKDERGFKCGDCGKSYVNEAGLRRHVKIIHSTTSAVFPCTYCSKPFASLDYMRHHERANCKFKKMQNQLASTDSDPVVVAVESISIDSNSGDIQHEGTMKREFILPDI